ncbi:MAG: heme exporter protein CcmB [Xanthomonadales bacterium]|nr:heme exporter protein CcmB [Xanthomonadales bacterium]NIT46231.1 heme exporter protein CcmB [Stutzerimonas stutzeri]NIN59911.1 heme exporter protein CcmB [Xanthomonadales bacterium]NIN75285.1 heme exporter protein CcmB [Xanthomonadales bacterium]NIO15154.1 heme exporter protein CcmB [Xanthomonadales bacterium]
MSGTSAWHAFTALLRRDLVLAFRRRTEMFQPLIFLLVVVSLFPLGVGPSPQLLASIAPGVIWIAALLATVLSLDTLFRSDFEDGTLEQFVVSGHPLTAIAFAKILAHWMVAGVPLVLMTPLLSLWMNLSVDGMVVMLVTLVLGTPVLSLVGSIGGALTVSLKRGGQLLSLLVFPLYVPLLIVATNAVSAAVAGLPYTGQLGLMVAGLIAALTLAPFATAAALKLSLE